MKIILTPDAFIDIENIHHFYYTYSEEIAIRISEKIFDEIRLLENFPTIGIKEPLPANLSGQYRYFLIVKGKFKIIYKIENETIYVISIWDCRRNPEKLQLIMEKKYNFNEEENNPNTLGEPTIEYGTQQDAEMEILPALTQEEEQELITGDELLEAVGKHIHKLFNQK